MGDEADKLPAGVENLVDADQTIPKIFLARLGSNGAVIKVPPPISKDEAINHRKLGHEVVVCGSILSHNRAVAREIEAAANGSVLRQNAHWTAGYLSMPHYQPSSRPPSGHTFYETKSHHAR